MVRRVLDWDGLLDVAQKKNAAERMLTVAGLPAAVKETRAGVGFYVYAVGEYAAADHWALRTEREVILLRHLVEAGQVTWDDGQPEPDEDLDGDLVEITTYGSEEPVMRLCAVCGAGRPDTPHDPQTHAQARKD